MIEILYEDNHLLVCNKPAGLLTQPSGTTQDSLESQAKAWIKSKYAKSGNVFLHAVHRLDKPVSGIVLFARTSKALARLQSTMRSKQARKIYIAIVEGRLDPREGVLEHYLVHEEHHARLGRPDEPEAKLARLHYRVLRQGKDHCEVEIELETGRYHQIRAQMALMGHPIRGDVRYGSHVKCDEGIIALHHTRLEIKHPITGEQLQFEAPFLKNSPLQPQL